jgi:hypothetical protein
MNKIFAIFFSAICCTNLVFSQKYQKAVVTDVNYILQLGGTTTNTDNFPLYFYYPEFIADIDSDIRKYTKEKFLVDSVEFYLLDSVFYTQAYFAPDLKVRDAAKFSHDKSVVYISVETLIRESAIINGVVLYKMITRVKAYRGGGKKIYKFKNQIPFETYRGEEITGNILMKENDFYAFYFDGLEMAFSGEIAKVEKRYIEQPPTKHYEDFLQNSEKFYMIQEKRKISYGKDVDDLSEILSFRSSPLNILDDELDFGNIFEGNFINDGCYLTNNFKNEEYKVKLKGGENTLFNFLSITKDIEINFLDKEKKEVGKFTFSSDGVMNGKFKDREYKMLWNYEYDVAEISSSEMLMLINVLDDRKVIFVRNDISEQELGDIFNLIFAYDFSLAAKLKAEANASNDRED